MPTDNFIYVKHDALSAEQCSHAINEIEETITLMKNNGVCEQGEHQLPNGKLGREDAQIFIPQDNRNLYTAMMPVLQGALDDYSNKYPALKGVGQVYPTNFKGQKTAKGEIGFAHFHCEQGAGASANRIIVWALYLNDVTEGGETEFPYQGVKVPPKQGTLVLFPASYTHTHRGNPPYSNDKYILTGWFNTVSTEALADIFRQM